MTTKPHVDRRVLWSLAATIALTAITVALYNPGIVSFRSDSLSEFVQLMLPLVMVALFIERVLEVFIASWRGPCASSLKERAARASTRRQPSGPRHADEVAYACHQHQTRRIAFLAGTALGVIVAALGVRVLEMFVDAAAFQSLPDVHQRLFRTTDVLMTGAVLGGGSDALHHLVLVFTNLFQITAGKVKGEEGGRGK
jgi:hypothetical protein